MLSPSDLALGWSTQFETLWLAEYNRSVAVSDAQLGGLVMDVTLEDFQGNKITFDWLGAAPQMEEWIDEKRSQGFNKQTWDVLSVDYAASVDIRWNALRDAKTNPYGPRIQEIASNAARLKYNLISDVIRTNPLCYDGQNFFDTDHVEGDSGTQTNSLTGAGVTQANIETDYYAAKSKLMGLKDDKGIPMSPADFRPLVWVPNDPTLIQRFNTLRGATLISNTSNVLVSEFDMVVDPRLTDANDWFMFRRDGALKPFVYLVREAPHYADDFGPGNPNLYQSRLYHAGAEGRVNAAPLMWQKAVRVTNT